MNFGEKLKRLRLDMGKSQARVARELRSRFPDYTVSQAHLSTLENRELAPRQITLEYLAAYYDVPVRYFLSDDGGDPKLSRRRRNTLDAARRWVADLRNGNDPLERFQTVTRDDVLVAMRNYNSDLPDF